MDRGLSRTQWLVLATGLLVTGAGISGLGWPRPPPLDVFGVFVVASTLTLVLYRPHRDGADLFSTVVLVLYAVLLITTVGIVVVLVVARH
jgi:hypothetical protein